jgi:hypothetical protein
LGKSEGRTADPSASHPSSKAAEDPVARDDNSSWELYLAFPKKIVIPTEAPQFLRFVAGLLSSWRITIRADSPHRLKETDHCFQIVRRQQGQHAARLRFDSFIHSGYFA